MLARVRISGIAAAATAGELGMLEVVVWRIARGTSWSSRPESDGCFAYVARIVPVPAWLCYTMLSICYNTQSDRGESVSRHAESDKDLENTTIES